MIRTKTTLESRFPEIIAGSEAGCALAVKHTCERIETRAKGHSRVDSGNLRAGWQHQMTGILEGVVFNLVEYAVYNEFGTIYMSAQPMLQPAVEESTGEFVQELAEVYEGGRLL